MGQIAAPFLAGHRMVFTGSHSEALPPAGGSPESQTAPSPAADPFPSDDAPPDAPCAARKLSGAARLLIIVLGAIAAWAMVGLALKLLRG